MVMKAEKIMANLYVLMGDTLQESNATLVSMNQEEVVMMWHRDLGICQSEGCRFLRNVISYPDSKRLIYLFVSTV